MRTMNIKLGDWLKVEGENHVFRVCGFSFGSKTIPDGWPMTEQGSFMNPRYCEKYEGATSVLTLNER